MAKDKVLDRQLSTEERQWLRDLPNHPGYRLVCQVLAELMAQDLQYILTSRAWEEVLEFRGSYQRSLKVLGLPKELQETDSSLNPRGSE